MRIEPNGKRLFGVDVQAAFEAWWRQDGVEEVLGGMFDDEGRPLKGYPFAFATIDPDEPVDWLDPLAHPQYVLRHVPHPSIAVKPGPVDFDGPIGLFANVAGKARAGEREEVSTIFLREEQPHRFREGDFPYGGWVRLTKEDGKRRGGLSGLPDGQRDHTATLRLFAKLDELEGAAVQPHIDAVGNRKKGAPDEERIKFMLHGDWWLTNGVLVPPRPPLLGGSPADVPGHTHSAGYQGAPLASPRRTVTN